MISPSLPTARVMLPSHLPKLTIHQPDWFEAKATLEREADFGFRREMALKKLWSVHDEEDINAYLQLDDDDPLIRAVLLDVGLYQGVHTESLQHLMREFGMLEGDDEEESEVCSEAAGDDDDAQSDGYLEYYGRSWVLIQLTYTSQVAHLANKSEPVSEYPLGEKSQQRPLQRHIHDRMTMGLCFSCFSRRASAICEAESRSLPRCEPRPGNDYQHTSYGPVPRRSMSDSSRSNGLRLILPPNLPRRDSIDRAMATNPSCGPEDSPTWINASPLTTKLAFHRDADPDGSKGLEHKDIEKYKQNKSSSVIWEPLGQSESSCVWDETTIKDMSSGLVVIEARRRVRKYYKEQYDAVRKELDDDLAARTGGLPDIARRLMEDKEWREKTSEAIRLTELIAEKKDEATRRVMPMLEARLKARR